MNITKISYGKYEVTKNDNKAIIEFSRNGRYDAFDGEYHPTWLFCYNGETVKCASKKQALEIASVKL